MAASFFRETAIYLVRCYGAFKMNTARICASIVISAAMLDAAVAQSPPIQPSPRPSARAAPPPAAGSDNTSYCVSGAAGFLTSEEHGIEATRSKCKRGDTMIIPATRTRIIARLCDFTKAVVTAEGNVVCVLTGTDRPER